MKMVIYLKISILIVLTCIIYDNGSVSAFHQYTSTDGSLTHVLLDQSGKVFLGGTNIILRFSNELDLEDSVSTKDFNCSGNDCRDNNVSIFVFYPFKTDTYLLFCGTSDYGSCHVYNRTNFDHVVKMEGFFKASVDNYLGSGTSAVAVPVKQGTYKGYIHSAMDYDGRKKEKFPKVFSVREVDEYENRLYMHYVNHYSQEYITLRDDLVRESMFDFKFGFHHDGYTYFLRNSKYVNKQAHISEVCSDIHYRSYIESEISCGGYVIIETAFLLRSDTVSTLYIVFSSSKYRGTALCGYTVHYLRSTLNRIRKDCFFRSIGSTPGWINVSETSCQTMQVGRVS